MKYKIPLAFICVTLIWSTTPLAIQWSSEGVGFLFAITSRMTIATIVCFILLRALGMSFPWHKAARQTYLSASVGIYFAMILVYWGAQFIPSGWVAVIFGASPMLTGLVAHRFLNETLTPAKVIGTVIGFAGLIIIFWTKDKLDLNSYYGLIAIMISTLIHTFSTIGVKRVNAAISPLATTCGALVYALPAYLLTWIIFDGNWPSMIPTKSIIAILYLGLIGSLVGFVLYFFVLKHLPASRVALITLVTPVNALLLGNVLNGEPLTKQIWLGTAIIIAGLICYEFVGKKKLNKSLDQKTDLVK